MDPRLRPLFEAATRPYVGAGTFAWRFARGKLRHDPVFFFLLRRGLLPDRESLLDLGCGRGILLSLLKAAKEQYQAGAWPRDWPAPPLNLGLRGIELSESRVRAARHALGGGARVDLCDLRNADLPPCSVIVMIDVLFYLHKEEQRRLIEKATEALEPAGCCCCARPMRTQGSCSRRQNGASGSLAHCAASSRGNCITAARFDGLPSWRHGVSPSASSR